VNRLRRYGWYESAPKKPPPERGIRIKKAGTTWWGQRWIEALEQVLRGDAGRLARGKTYARAGRTHDFVVKRGKVAAKVTGSRATPYEISIALTQLGEAVWSKAIAGMAKKAQFSAELLGGRMPNEIDEVFREAGASLVPEQRGDLATSCSCPDWGDPCKHVAAAHYVLGEALDRDPFLLFELRGRTREQVLDALRAARGGAREKGAGKSSKTRKSEESRDAEREIPSVKLGKLKAADYDKPRAALPALSFTFEEPHTPGALLRQLGAPATWRDDTLPADVFAPLLRVAGEAARRLAMAEQNRDAIESSGPASIQPTSPRTRTPRKKA
jgi:uncharacterized Zn finger protein